MKKTGYIAAALLLVFSGSWSHAESQKPTLAAWDLELAEQVDASARIPLSDILRNELWQTGRFTVVDRSSMGRILEEQEFQQTGCASNECIVEAGQILGVQKMVSGRLGRLGRKYILNIQLIDVETGIIEKIASSECICRLEDLTDTVHQAVQELTGLFTTPLQDLSKPSQGPAQPLRENTAAKRSADSAKRLMDRVRTAANRINADNLVSAIWESAESERQDGDTFYREGKYASAEQCYKKAAGLFEQTRTDARQGDNLEKLDADFDQKMEAFEAKAESILQGHEQRLLELDRKEASDKAYVSEQNRYDQEMDALAREKERYQESFHEKKRKMMDGGN